MRLSSLILALASPLAFIFPLPAQAGFVEVGASGSIRRTNIGTDSYEKAESLTASLSYYFTEASAIEISYTDGYKKHAIVEGQPNAQVTELFYKSLGLDFVYTIGGREAGFRPYIKAGGNYILKNRIVSQVRDANGTLFDPNTREEPAALVPSAGIGFKLGLTQQLSLKTGVDAWTSRPIHEDPVTIDYAARLGLSWFF